MCVNSLRAVEIPPIKDEYLFEDFCLDYWKHKLNNMDVQKNGRRGQRQQGIDIFGRDGSLQWIGVQCKVKPQEIGATEKECNEDIKKAFAFNPKLADNHYRYNAQEMRGFARIHQKKTMIINSAPSEYMLDSGMILKTIRI